MIKNCTNCGKEFEQPSGKREKRFCSDSCRATHNQKQKSKYIRITKEEWNKFNETKTSVTNFTQEAPKTNYTINTIREMCPKELVGLERSQWISNKRKEYNI